MDHIRNNMIKMTIDVDQMGLSLTPSQISKGAKRLRAHSNYKMLSAVEQERKKMEHERVKIKNLIGNNPFRVKNYVQGDDLDNNLVPLKLLKPKSKNFADDDEFIENYLIEKAKEEKREAEERRKQTRVLKVKAGLSASIGKMLKKGKQGSMLSKISSEMDSKLGVTKRSSKAASPTRITDEGSREGKSTQLKNQLQQLIERKAQKKARLQEETKEAIGEQLAGVFTRKKEQLADLEVKK